MQMKQKYLDLHFRYEGKKSKTMKIVQKIRQKQESLMGHQGITIGFLGDSVTQGCFELYMKNAETAETCFDQNCGYHNYLKIILSMLFPRVPINIINGGISGNDAVQGLQRLERDILRYHPDLLVVCFGLNDSVKGLDKIQEYTEALKGIFKKLLEEEIEVIFMTPNMMCTEISPHLEKEKFRHIAEQAVVIQTEQVMDAYMDAAIKVCQEYEIKVCDCYRKWKKFQESGVIISDLLANYINHPTREMNWLFAVSLVETMFEIS